MLKRTIYLSSPLKISVKDEQLLITLRDNDKPTSTVPIEDLAHVVIENQQVSITIPALNALKHATHSDESTRQQHFAGTTLPYTTRGLIAY